MAPDGWTSRRLLECADRITSGGTPKIGRADYYGGKIPFLKIDDLTQTRGLYLRSANTSITEKALAETAAKLYPANTVLVTMYGTIGAVGITAVPMAANQAIGAFLDLKGVAPDFLAYLLSREAPALARKAGRTTQSNINGLILKNHLVLLPPIPEQNKIAAILSSVDDAIEKTQAVIDQAQVVKRGLMHELLTRGLPGRHTRFKQTDIGEIPQSWELVPLEQLIANGPDNGLYRPQSEYGKGVPIVRIDAFDNGDRLRTPSLRRVYIGPADVGKFIVRPGDILINRVNSMSHLAKCALAVSFEEPTVYESNMMRLTLDDSRIVTEFGFMWLSCEHVKKHLKRRAKKAVAQASVNQNDVRTIPTPCPPRSEQQRIADVVGTIEQRIEAETGALAQFNAVKSALMTALLTGEIRVTRDPKAA